MPLSEAHLHFSSAVRPEVLSNPVEHKADCQACTWMKAATSHILPCTRSVVWLWLRQQTYQLDAARLIKCWRSGVEFVDASLDTRTGTGKYPICNMLDYSGCLVARDLEEDWERQTIGCIVRRRPIDDCLVGSGIIFPNKGREAPDKGSRRHVCRVSLRVADHSRGFNVGLLSTGYHDSVDCQLS